MNFHSKRKEKKKKKKTDARCGWNEIPDKFKIATREGG